MPVESMDQPPSSACDFQTVHPVYHATSQRIAEFIELNQSFMTSDEDRHLGAGVYFWEQALGYTIYWMRKARSRVYPYAVIEAKVNLGRCMDLREILWALHVRWYKNNLGRFLPALRKIAKEQNKPFKITAGTIMHWVARDAEVDSVRGVQMKHEKLIEDSPLPFEQAVMICMRNKSLISNVIIVDEDICKNIAMSDKVKIRDLIIAEDVNALFEALTDDVSLQLMAEESEPEFDLEYAIRERQEQIAESEAKTKLIQGLADSATQVHFFATCIQQTQLKADDRIQKQIFKDQFTEEKDAFNWDEYFENCVAA